METQIKTSRSNIEKVTHEIYSTDNYDLFKHRLGNRLIDSKLVNKIYNSIVLYGWWRSSTITIGEGMVVLDGQHRIEALKKFHKEHGVKYKVTYIVDREMDSIDKIIAAQNHRGGWSIMAYADSKIQENNETYIVYKEFRDKYKLSHSVTLYLLNGTISDKQLSKKYKGGKLEIKDYDRAIIWSERIIELKKILRFAHHQAFVKAIIYFWKHSQFSHKEFVQKLLLNREVIYQVSNPAQYQRLIAAVYNYKRRDKVKFKFDEE